MHFLIVLLKTVIVVMVICAALSRFGWRSCPACKSRATTQHRGEPSFDTHVPVVHLCRELWCMRCNHVSVIKRWRMSREEYLHETRRNLGTHSRQEW